MSTAISPAIAINPTPAALRELAPLAPHEMPPPDQHPARVYLAGLASGSRRAMEGALHKVAAVLTKNRATAFTLPWWRLRQMSTDDYHRAVDLTPVRGETLPAGRALSSGEIRALFEACSQQNGVMGARDAALLALLYGCGLRRASAAALQYPRDYDKKTGELRVHGKGNKQLMAYVNTNGRQALAAWLAWRGEQEGPLFLALTPGHRITERALTDQAVRVILLRRAVQAGVENVTTHDLRRTFISDLLDAGADLVTVKRMAGHADVSTTARYDRRGEETKRKASDLIHIPFVAIAPHRKALKKK